MYERQAFLVFKEEGTPQENDVYRRDGTGGA
jgi:hypothetical protein